MSQVKEAGWKQADKIEDKASIKEDEVKTIFNLIDKDGSGTLSRRVII